MGSLALGGGERRVDDGVRRAERNLVEGPIQSRALEQREAATALVAVEAVGVGLSRFQDGPDIRPNLRAIIGADLGTK